jgi:peptide/nickel transport system permease protein
MAIRQLASLAGTVLIGGLLTAALIRNSPGFDVDERQLDTRLDAQSHAQARSEHAAYDNLFRFYGQYMKGLLHGDLGMSSSLDAPIAELIRARLPVTARNMALGLAGGWLLAFLLALTNSRIVAAFSVLLLSAPSAALAVLVFVLHGPLYWVIALVLFPQLFDYLRNLFADAYEQPHIVTAQAKGVPPAFIFWRHVLPVCGPQLLALAGISTTIAFAATIPVETLGGLPGIGQLAWQAATARDLPLLMVLTMLITLFTQVCNMVSDAWGRA